MRAKALAVATFVVVMFSVGISSATTLAGDWSGHFKGRISSSAVTFSVSAKGRQLVVSNFQAAKAIRPPCADTPLTALVGPPNATVTARGRFKAVGSEAGGFGEQRWKVSGKFSGAHAASGTVAVFLPGPKPCRFTLKWSATSVAAAAPKAGAVYASKTVSLHVGADGKTLSSITWRGPILGGNCPPLQNGPPSFTAHNVPIHNSTFSYTEHTSGADGTATFSISGQFLAGNNAAGQLSTVSRTTGFGVCQGSGTWTAHR